MSDTAGMTIKQFAKARHCEELFEAVFSRSWEPLKMVWIGSAYDDGILMYIAHYLNWSDGVHIVRDPVDGIGVTILPVHSCIIHQLTYHAAQTFFQKTLSDLLDYVVKNNEEYKFVSPAILQRYLDSKLVLIKGG